MIKTGIKNQYHRGLKNTSKAIAALYVSRTLSQFSTAYDADGLNVRVRYESGCDPAAVAAITKPSSGKGIQASQGPDLNWGIAALQAAARPLRHLGNNNCST